ncbi:hypothetical protein DdX_09153 [Ditylenchus destructor]|uniref:Uncharacterized protein n=1 Tax=Ditylenchus destructor TaxID=166010 RepID=A0AAD4N6K1_9BILA|nr:hypothetical protein DdX_09153 [Ditylenchus destructor]
MCNSSGKTKPLSIKTLLRIEIAGQDGAEPTKKNFRFDVEPDSNGEIKTSLRTLIDHALDALSQMSGVNYTLTSAEYEEDYWEEKVHAFLDEPIKWQISDDGDLWAEYFISVKSSVPKVESESKVDLNDSIETAIELGAESELDTDDYIACVEKMATEIHCYEKMVKGTLTKDLEQPRESKSTATETVPLISHDAGSDKIFVWFNAPNPGEKCKTSQYTQIYGANWLTSSSGDKKFTLEIKDINSFCSGFGAPILSDVFRMIQNSVKYRPEGTTCLDLKRRYAEYYAFDPDFQDFVALPGHSQVRGGAHYYICAIRFFDDITPPSGKFSLALEKIFLAATAPKEEKIFVWFVGYKHGEIKQSFSQYCQIFGGYSKCAPSLLEKKFALSVAAVKRGSREATLQGVLDLVKNAAKTEWEKWEWNVESCHTFDAAFHEYSALPDMLETKVEGGHNYYLMCSAKPKFRNVPGWGRPKTRQQMLGLVDSDEEEDANKDYPPVFAPVSPRFNNYGPVSNGECWDGDNRSQVNGGFCNAGFGSWTSPPKSGWSNNRSEW